MALMERSEKAMKNSMLFELAPQPGLEPGTYGLTESGLGMGATQDMRLLRPLATEWPASGAALGLTRATPHSTSTYAV